MSNCLPGTFPDALTPSPGHPPPLPGGQPFRVTATYLGRAKDPDVFIAAGKQPESSGLDLITGRRDASFDYPDAKQAEQAWKRLKAIEGVSVEVEN